MAITTYAELATALADRINRSDFSATVIGECVTLAEEQLQNELETTDMEARMSLLDLDEYVDFPPGFMAVRNIHLNSNPRRLLRPEVDYQVVANKLYFPSLTNLPTRSATLVYYSKIPALTSVNTTNWVLADFPSVYLYGTMLQAAIRLKDPTLAQGCEALYQSAIAWIKRRSAKKRWGGQGMAVRVA